MRLSFYLCSLKLKKNENPQTENEPANEVTSPKFLQLQNTGSWRGQVLPRQDSVPLCVSSLGEGSECWQVLCCVEVANTTLQNTVVEVN